MEDATTEDDGNGGEDDIENGGDEDLLNFKA